MVRLQSLEASWLGTIELSLTFVVLNVCAIFSCEVFFGFLISKNLLSSYLLIAIDRLVELFIIIYFAYQHGPGIDAIGFEPSQLKIATVKGLLWSLAFGAVVLIIFIGLFLAGINPFIIFAAKIPHGPLDAINLFIVGGLISPIAEEFFFRGIVFNFLRKWGRFLAIVLSTACFVLAHARFSGLPLPQIVGGIVFAGVFEKEKHLMVPIIIHILGNCAIFSLPWVANLW